MQSSSIISAIPPLEPQHITDRVRNSIRKGTAIYAINSSSREVPHFLDLTLMRPFVWAVPNRVLPNHITLLRFLLIPFVMSALIMEYYEIGLILFLIAAFTDALDGAVARVRGLITDWGKLFDPLADKLLIGGTAVIVIVKFLNPYIALLIVLIEAWLVLYNLFFRSRQKKIVGARLEGKLKMILQCLGVGLVLLYAIWPLPGLLEAATYILSVAIFFGGLSLFVYKTI